VHSDTLKQRKARNGSSQAQAKNGQQDIKFENFLLFGAREFGVLRLNSFLCEAERKLRDGAEMEFKGRKLNCGASTVYGQSRLALVVCDYATLRALATAYKYSTVQYTVTHISN
jgi:hypothetical protein